MKKRWKDFVDLCNKHLIANSRELMIGTPIAFVGRGIKPTTTRSCILCQFKNISREFGWYTKSLTGYDERDALILVRNELPELWSDPRSDKYRDMFQAFALQEYGVYLEDGFFHEYNAGHIYNSARAENFYESYVRIHPMHWEVNQSLGRRYEYWAGDENRLRWNFISADQIIVGAAVGITPPEDHKNIDKYIASFVECGLSDSISAQALPSILKKNWDTAFGGKGAIISVSHEGISVQDFEDRAELRSGKRFPVEDISILSPRYAPSRIINMAKSIRNSSSSHSEYVSNFESEYSTYMKSLLDTYKLYNGQYRRDDDRDERRSLSLRIVIESYEYKIVKLQDRLLETKGEDRKKIKLELDHHQRELCRVRRAWAFRSIERPEFYPLRRETTPRWLLSRRRKENGMLSQAERSSRSSKNHEDEIKSRTSQLKWNRKQRKLHVKRALFKN